MEKRSARTSREIVVPGDVLDNSGMNAGNYTYVLNGKVYADVLGVKNVFQNTVSVIPLGGRYMPATGDTVIGVIEDIGPSNWLVNINAPYPAPLHVKLLVEAQFSYHFELLPDKQVSSSFAVLYV